MRKKDTKLQKDILEELGHDPFNPRMEYDHLEQTLGGKPIEFHENWSNSFLMNNKKIELNRTVNMINNRKVSVYYSDREHYVRVYPQGIKAIIERAKEYSNQLGKKSIVNGVNAVLLYLMTNCKYFDKTAISECSNADEISLVKLSSTVMLEECNIGRSTAEAVLSFLVKENVICKRDPNHYWINYECIFPGVRADYIMRFQPIKVDVKFTRRDDLDKKK